MTEGCRRFCVLTVGRSGSTSLMNVLQAQDDIAVPNKNIDCVDNELVHPKFVGRYALTYSRLCNTPIINQDQLIECFYRYNTQARYCGFKSMPDRHPRFEAFAGRRDITFITLTRDDIASTVASFMLAMNAGTWRRAGEPPAKSWTFTAGDRQRVAGNLAYIMRGLAQLRQLPGAIHLSFESLCAADFSHPALNEYFGRPIRLSSPRAPVHGSSYVTNWQEFVEFVTITRAQFIKESPDWSGEENRA